MIICELRWGSGEETVWGRWEKEKEKRSERVFPPPKFLNTFGHKSIFIGILITYKLLYFTETP